MSEPVTLNFEETISTPTTVLNFGTRSVGVGGTISFTELSEHIRQMADMDNVPCKQFILSVVLGKFQSGDYSTALDNAPPTA